MAEVYANAKLLMVSDGVGWLSPSSKFRCLLVAASYTYSHVQATVADVMAHEVSGGTYARQDVTGRTVSLDLAGNRALMRAAGTVFPSLSGVAPAGAIIYKQVGGDDATPGNDPLLAYLAFAETATSGLDCLIEYDPDGVVSLVKC